MGGGLFLFIVRRRRGSLDIGEGHCLICGGEASVVRLCLVVLLLVGGGIGLWQRRPIGGRWVVDRGRSIRGPNQFLVVPPQTMGTLG